MSDAIAVIVNANPAMKRRAPDLEAIRRAAGGRCAVLPTRSLEELEAQAKMVMSAPPGALAIWGGDGTNTNTLSALLRHSEGRALPPICFLPGGTVNNVSRTLGAQGSPMRCFERFLAGAVQEAQRTLVQVEAEGEHPLRVGFLFGVGLISNAMELYDRGRGTGALETLRVVAGALPSLVRERPGDGLFRPFAARVLVDGRLWARPEWTNLCAAGIDTLPYGLRAFDRSTERPGAFHFIGHAHRARGALAELVSIARGKGMRAVQEVVAERAELSLAQPMPFNLDGENFEPRARMSIRAAPVISALVPQA